MTVFATPQRLLDLHQRLLAEDPAYREWCDWAAWVRSLPVPDCPTGPVLYREDPDMTGKFIPDEQPPDIHDEIDQRFGFHPNRGPEDVAAHEYVRSVMASVTHDLVDLVPAGRERALMVTALDQAAMYANAGLARARPLG